MGPDFAIKGVTFDTIRCALTDLFFRTKDMTHEQFNAAAEYVVPMVHNWENPLQPGSGDTYIQYWIDETDRLTEDYSQNNMNVTLKVAHITLRFIGAKAEQWALSFHHLTKRRSWATILLAYCNGRDLKYVSPVVCHNINYFGAANAVKAFTTTFKIEYDEVIDFTQGGSGADRLEYINLASGIAVEGGVDDAP